MGKWAREADFTKRFRGFLIPVRMIFNVRILLPDLRDAYEAVISEEWDKLLRIAKRLRNDIQRLYEARIISEDTKDILMSDVDGLESAAQTKDERLALVSIANAFSELSRYL